MNSIEDELRKEIRSAILKVCKDHNINETEIKYKLNLSVSYEIDDEIIKDNNYVRSIN